MQPSLYEFILYLIGFCFINLFNSLVKAYLQCTIRNESYPSPAQIENYINKLGNFWFENLITLNIH